MFRHPLPISLDSWPQHILSPSPPPFFHLFLSLSFHIFTCPFLLPPPSPLLSPFLPIPPSLVQHYSDQVRHSPEVQFAVDVALAIDSNNFVKFFKLAQ